MKLEIQESKKNQLVYYEIDKLTEVGIDNCAISEITLAELVFGAEKSDNLIRIINSLKNLLDK